MSDIIIYFDLNARTINLLHYWTGFNCVVNPRRMREGYGSRSVCAIILNLKFIVK